MNRMSNFTYLGKRINEAFYQNQAIVNTFRESPGVGGIGIVDNEYTWVVFPCLLSNISLYEM